MQVELLPEVLLKELARVLSKLNIHLSVICEYLQRQILVAIVLLPRLECLGVL